MIRHQSTLMIDGETRFVRERTDISSIIRQSLNRLECLFNLQGISFPCKVRSAPSANQQAVSLVLGTNLGMLIGTQVQVNGGKWWRVSVECGVVHQECTSSSHCHYAFNDLMSTGSIYPRTLQIHSFPPSNSSCRSFSSWTRPALCTCCTVPTGWSLPVRPLFFHILSQITLDKLHILIRMVSPLSSRGLTDFHPFVFCICIFPLSLRTIQTRYRHCIRKAQPSRMTTLIGP